MSAFINFTGSVGNIFLNPLYCITNLDNMFLYLLCSFHLSLYSLSGLIASCWYLAHWIMYMVNRLTELFNLLWCLLNVFRHLVRCSKYLAWHLTCLVALFLYLFKLKLINFTYSSTCENHKYTGKNHCCYSYLHIRQFCCRITCIHSMPDNIYDIGYKSARGNKCTTSDIHIKDNCHVHRKSVCICHWTCGSQDSEYI